MGRTHTLQLLLLALATATPLLPAAASAAGEPLWTSAISAAPGLLPRIPRLSSFPPALSPDTMPVFPTPGGGAAPPPSSGALPTIPSSQSPPNPDALEPGFALAPLSSAAAGGGGGAVSPATSVGEASRGRVAAALLGLVAVWVV